MKVEIAIQPPTRRGLLITAAVAALVLPVIALAAPVEIPNEFSDGDVIDAEAFNENFDAIAAAIDDNDARLADVESSVAALVPSGTIAFFAANACPAGWSEHQDMRGRVPLGVPSGGVVSVTGGTPYGDQDARHITQVPAHTHGVSLSGSTADAGAHNHQMQTAGEHSHSIQLEYGSGTGTAGALGMPNNIGGGLANSIIADAGDHTHVINFSTDHAHTVSLSGNTASAGIEMVDITVPYLQLLPCEKT